MKRIVTFLIAIATAALASAQAGSVPCHDLGDQDVRDPCAPDARFVAFVVSDDVKEDKAGSGHLWTIGIDGGTSGDHVRADSEASPRFSPDGRRTGLPSSRPGKAKGSQVWLLDGRRRSGSADRGRRAGCRACRPTRSGSRSRSASDPDATDTPGEWRTGGWADAPQGAPPIVIDRYK